MTPEEIEDLEVQEINDLTQIATITGDENFPVQTPAGNNLACKAAQIAGYAFPATCNSAADAATKVVVITGYHGTVLPQLVAVTFTNGNTYGDVTASPATHPYIQFKNADNVNLGNAKSLCDCLGNYAGTGCLKAGNIAILRTLGDRTLITNSDVRQQTDNMTIKADGSKEYNENIKSSKNITPSSIGDIYGDYITLKANRKYLLIGAVNVVIGSNTISSVTFNFTDASKIELLTQLHPTKGSSSNGVCQQNSLVLSVLDDVQVRVQSYAYMANVAYSVYLSAVTIN